MNENHGRMCKCDDCQQILADEWLAYEGEPKPEAAGGESEGVDTDLF